MSTLLPTITMMMMLAALASAQPYAQYFGPTSAAPTSGAPSSGAPASGSSGYPLYIYNDGRMKFYSWTSDLTDFVEVKFDVYYPYYSSRYVAVRLTWDQPSYWEGLCYMTIDSLYDSNVGHVACQVPNNYLTGALIISAQAIDSSNLANANFADFYSSYYKTKIAFGLPPIQSITVTDGALGIGSTVDFDLTFTYPYTPSNMYGYNNYSTSSVSLYWKKYDNSDEITHVWCESSIMVTTASGWLRCKIADGQQPLFGSRETVPAHLSLGGGAFDTGLLWRLPATLDAKSAACNWTVADASAECAKTPTDLSSAIDFNITVTGRKFTTIVQAGSVLRFTFQSDQSTTKRFELDCSQTYVIMNDTTLVCTVNSTAKTDLKNVFLAKPVTKNHMTSNPNAWIFATTVYLRTVDGFYSSQDAQFYIRGEETALLEYSDVNLPFLVLSSPVSRAPFYINRWVEQASLSSVSLWFRNSSVNITASCTVVQPSWRTKVVCEIPTSTPGFILGDFVVSSAVVDSVQTNNVVIGAISIGAFIEGDSSRKITCYDWSYSHYCNVDSVVLVVPPGKGFSGNIIVSSFMEFIGLNNNNTVIASVTCDYLASFWGSVLTTKTYISCMYNGTVEPFSRVYITATIADLVTPRTAVGVVWRDPYFYGATGVSPQISTNGGDIQIFGDNLHSTANVLVNDKNCVVQQVNATYVRCSLAPNNGILAGGVQKVTAQLISSFDISSNMTIWANRTVIPQNYYCIYSYSCNFLLRGTFLEDISSVSLPDSSVYISYSVRSDHSVVINMNYPPSNGSYTFTFTFFGEYSPRKIYIGNVFVVSSYEYGPQPPNSNNFALLSDIAVGYKVTLGKDFPALNFSRFLFEIVPIREGYTNPNAPAGAGAPTYYNAPSYYYYGAPQSQQSSYFYLEGTPFTCGESNVGTATSQDGLTVCTVDSADWIWYLSAFQPTSLQLRVKFLVYYYYYYYYSDEYGYYNIVYTSKITDVWSSAPTVGPIARPLPTIRLDATSYTFPCANIFTEEENSTAIATLALGGDTTNARRAEFELSLLNQTTCYVSLHDLVSGDIKFISFRARGISYTLPTDVAICTVVKPEKIRFSLQGTTAPDQETIQNIIKQLATVWGLPEGSFIVRFYPAGYPKQRAATLDFAMEIEFFTPDSIAQYQLLTDSSHSEQQQDEIKRFVITIESASNLKVSSAPFAIQDSYHVTDGYFGLTLGGAAAIGIFSTLFVVILVLLILFFAWRHKRVVKKMAKQKDAHEKELEQVRSQFSSPGEARAAPASSVSAAGAPTTKPEKKDAKKEKAKKSESSLSKDHDEDEKEEENDDVSSSSDESESNESS